jgi:lysozyme family protein
VFLLQRALDTVQDGHIGPQTLKLAAAATPWHAARYLALRAARYVETRNFDRFGLGWFTRLFELAKEQ